MRVAESTNTRVAFQITMEFFDVVSNVTNRFSIFATILAGYFESFRNLICFTNLPRILVISLPK